jgi:hypothetical protein
MLSAIDIVMNTSKMSLKSVSPTSLNKTVYGKIRNRFEDNSKIVFKELMGERKLQDSPGIVYDSHLINPAINTKKETYTFKRETRDMEYTVKQGKRIPAPGQYKDI